MPEDPISIATEKLAVPVYEDALKPFAKELSKGLVSIARMVNSGVYLIEDCVSATTNVLRMTAENLALLPPERVTFERPRVALQALNEAKFAINEEEIQKLFANLISSSFDKGKSNSAHPSYIEIIKQLQSDEALILKFMFGKDAHRKGHAPTIDITRADGDKNSFSVSETIYDVNLICEDAGCVDISSLYFSNLSRLGLIIGSESSSFAQCEHERIFQSEKAKELLTVNSHLQHTTYKCGEFSLTKFGHEFARVCIL